MDKKEVYESLKRILNEDLIFIDEPMKNHISFKVGGPADILVRPTTEEEIQAVFKLATENKLPFFEIGRASCRERV